MSDFTSGFWSLYVIVITALSILACAALLVVMSKVKTGANADDIAAKMRALRLVGVPYTDDQIKAAPGELKDKTEEDALVAYLQNLGIVMKNAR